MSNGRANDDNGAQGSLAHNVGWSDVWAGLLLTLFLFGSAILVAVFFSDRTSSLSNEYEPAWVHAPHLQGVRDLGRPGWRPADRPWDLMGIHQMTLDIDNRHRGRGEATMETFIADVRQARPR
jgi:hypothetical protein